MFTIQTRLFQVVIADGTGFKQADADTARSNLQSQVNTFLTSLSPLDILDVKFREESVTNTVLIFTSEVIYRQH